jgi:RNA polymerase sigma-70 factor (ECF subfamily)
MVIQLAINLLGDRDEALDLSQDVFLRVFRTIHRFRGQSSLRTWIYRIAVNQARNRHRFWRRRHRADQVSLDAHVATHGDFVSPQLGRPGPGPGAKGARVAARTRARPSAVRPSARRSCYGKWTV